MRNKKSFLSLGILALVLVLGVGYAAVSTVQLTIGGTASAKEATLKVSLKSAENDIAEDSTASVTHTFAAGDTEDKFTISDMSLNETITITYKIQNEETDVDAILTENTTLTNSNPTNFEVSYDIKTAEVAAGTEEGEVTVTVKLIKTPVDDTENSTSISFVLDAAPNAGN